MVLWAVAFFAFTVSNENEFFFNLISLRLKSGTKRKDEKREKPERQYKSDKYWSLSSAGEMEEAKTPISISFRMNPCKLNLKLNYI